ncbi:hypothetical protein HJFPF1_06316 [Paramyrothecium foliicola]|nr:hypothetical protein HJFPF1_06316 [Paramyrothecium foliicola]
MDTNGDHTKTQTDRAAEPRLPTSRPPSASSSTKAPFPAPPSDDTPRPSSLPVEAKVDATTVSVSPAPAGPSSAPFAATNAPELPADSKEKPVDAASARQLNGHKHGADEHDVESELSEPDSNVHSPTAPVNLNALEDEIVVGAHTNGARKTSPRRAGDEDEEMQEASDEPAFSHYPKRKRTQTHMDLDESRTDVPAATEVDRTPLPTHLKAKPPRQSLGSVKGVMLGYWRDSPVPDVENKHAVIGFIDVRDRLRTRIQPNNRAGEAVPPDYPVPPGPGGSWVTFERCVFFDHLVGLDHWQVKEYVRQRSEAVENTDEERRAAEKAAVKEAIRRVQSDPTIEGNNLQPIIAYGEHLPDETTTPIRPDKRRKTSNGYPAMNPSPVNTNGQNQNQNQNFVSVGRHGLADPLLGTRPTRILLGYWRGSSEPDPKNRHAVYGILGMNDMFRVKLVRESRDGRFVDGNFPTGAGALWIQWDEVVFEPHLQNMHRSEIKEYCRVRQYQIDQGELPEDRLANEQIAVKEAIVRAGVTHKHVNQLIAPAPAPAAVESPMVPQEEMNGIRPELGPGGHELRQSRRVDARSDGRPIRQATIDDEPRNLVRPLNPDAIERTTNLARREIARVEAAQGRADRHAVQRERAAAAAAADANAAAAAAASSAPMPAATNGRMRFHETDDMQRLNKVWARQETLRMKAGAEDAKMYDGIKYERKATGPFMGKLVSQGTIINIDGEDYVEYRVLTKPSFF